MKNQILGIQFTLLLLLLTSVRVKSRQWQSIVDHEIIRKSNIDSSRYELKIEVDPFFYPGEESVTDIPTEPQTAEAIKAWTPVASIASPSMVPAAKPTETIIEQNGVCGNGKKHYEVHMMDTWGDGWDQTMITITGMSDQDPSATNVMQSSFNNNNGDKVFAFSKTIELDSTESSEKNPLGQIFEATLQEGYHDFADICLVPNRCYQLIATGGEFLEEVSWDLRPGNNDPESSSGLMEPILSGGAPTECSFSLPDENGDHFCPNTCTVKIQITNPSIETIDPPKVVETVQTTDEEVTQAVGRTQTVPIDLSSSARTGNSASSMWTTMRADDEVTDEIADEVADEDTSN